MAKSSKRIRRVELIKTRAGKVRIRAVGANGEITSVGQPYASSQGARRAAKREYPDRPLVWVK